MFFRKIDLLNKSLDKINESMQNKNVQELISILGSKKKIFWRNFWAGIARGIGIGIGVTIITAILILLMRNIVALNIPVIGEFIADIVDIVEKSR